MSDKNCVQVHIVNHIDYNYIAKNMNNLQLLTVVKHHAVPLKEELKELKDVIFKKILTKGIHSGTRRSIREVVVLQGDGVVVDALPICGVIALNLLGIKRSHPDGDQYPLLLPSSFFSSSALLRLLQLPHRLLLAGVAPHPSPLFQIPMPFNQIKRHTTPK